MRHNVERRRANPSVVVPLLFFSLETVMGWLILSLIELTPSLYQWSAVSYVLMAIWVLYTASKLRRVLLRQRTHSSLYY